MVTSVSRKPVKHHPHPGGNPSGSPALLGYRRNGLLTTRRKPREPDASSPSQELPADFALSGFVLVMVLRRRPLDFSKCDDVAKPRAVAIPKYGALVPEVSDTEVVLSAWALHVPLLTLFSEENKLVEALKPLRRR